MTSLTAELIALFQAEPVADVTPGQDVVPTLTLAARQLHDLGYGELLAEDLRRHHVDALVRLWHAQQLDVDVIDARIDVLRWWAGTVKRRYAVHNNPALHGMPVHAQPNPRPRGGWLQSVQDPYARASIALVMSFGLQRMECVQIVPAQADLGSHVLILASWSSTCRNRRIPVASVAQRQCLDYAKLVAGQGSLIREPLRYRGQLMELRAQTRHTALPSISYLRRNYALERYQQLTGRRWSAARSHPHARPGAAAQALDLHAQLTIEQEMGLAIGLDEFLAGRPRTNKRPLPASRRARVAANAAAGLTPDKDTS
ncbi:hypothetical protein [Rugamonas aquatica]|uniref:Integrase n=1 Tax=Rugamonas aquatica TaxID=2743357 RepID=A0A6A7N6C1_9BURK|nr:hypothetical protein [Rugamonas aquatica]MQA40644.1 hypothetical protein [Rugamonas aquatica]